MRWIWEAHCQVRGWKVKPRSAAKQQSKKPKRCHQEVHWFYVPWSNLEKLLLQANCWGWLGHGSIAETTGCSKLDKTRTTFPTIHIHFWSLLELPTRRWKVSRIRSSILSKVRLLVAEKSKFYFGRIRPRTTQQRLSFNEQVLDFSSDCQ